MSEELEHGRHRLTVLPDDSLVLTRTVDLCETCAGCHCGTPQEPIVLPSVFGKILTGKRVEMHEVMALAATLPALLKGLTGGRGTTPGDSSESVPVPAGRRAARRARRAAGGVGLPVETGNSEADPASTAVAR